MAIQPLALLPDPPLPTDAEEVFDGKAGATLTAQQYMVNVDFNTKLIPAINAATLQITADKGDSAASALAASQSATAAANSATAATNNGAAQVQLATTQAQLATSNGQEQVALAAEQADNAEASALSAQAYAQAAGAGAGVPEPVPNKFLGTDSAGVVGWRDAGQKIGDTIFSAQNPGSTYLPLNGGVYSQAAYPGLFSIVGLISGSFAETWSAVTSNAGSNAINAVETDGNGVWVAAGAAGTMVRSTDNGVTWTAVTSGFGSTAINGLACDRANVWVAVGASGKVTRSADNGATWTAVTSGVADTLYSVASDRNSVFVATVILSAGAQAVIRSTNKGSSWSSVTLDPSSIAGHKAIATDRRGVWMISTPGGFFWRSTDDGATWVTISGVGGLATNRIATDGKGVWVAPNGASTAQYARSEDNGLTWKGVLVSSTQASSVIATDSNGNWISGNLSNQVYRSTDNGMSWATVAVAGLTNGALAAAFGKDGVAVVGAAAAAGILRRSTPTYGYDTATQFKLPNQPAAIGLAAYIKAKDA